MAAVRRCWPLPCAHCTSARSEAYAAPLLPRPPGCRRRGGEAGAGSSRGAGLPAVPAAAAFPLPSFAPACGPHSCPCPHPLVCSFAHTPWLPCLASSFLFRRLCRSPQPTAARCPASCCECSCVALAGLWPRRAGRQAACAACLLFIALCRSAPDHHLPAGHAASILAACNRLPRACCRIHFCRCHAEQLSSALTLPPFHVQAVTR